MDQCPANDKIPVWSLVFGIVMFVNACVNNVEDTRHKARVRAGEASENDKKHSPVYYLIGCFMWGWNIWGSVIVFDCDGCSDAFTPANNTTDASGCDDMMYEFAFVSLVMIWSICAFLILILVIYLFSFLDWKKVCGSCGDCPRNCGNACGTSLGHCLDAYHRVFGSGNKSFEEYKRSRQADGKGAGGATHADNATAYAAAAPPSELVSAGSIA